MNEVRLIDLAKVETHKQLEPNGNGDYKEVEVVYKDDLENLETWTPEEVTLWYLTQNNFTKIEDNRKGHEKTYKLVQYGHWVDIDYPVSECSICKYMVDTLNIATSYCPNCGALMKGADDE